MATSTAIVKQARALRPTPIDSRDLSHRSHVDPYCGPGHLPDSATPLHEKYDTGTTTSSTRVLLGERRSPHNQPMRASRPAKPRRAPQRLRPRKVPPCRPPKKGLQTVMPFTQKATHTRRAPLTPRPRKRRPTRSPTPRRPPKRRPKGTRPHRTPKAPRKPRRPPPLNIRRTALTEPNIRVRPMLIRRVATSGLKSRRLHRMKTGGRPRGLNKSARTNPMVSITPTTCPSGPVRRPLPWPAPRALRAVPPASRTTSAQSPLPAPAPRPASTPPSLV